MKTTTNSYLNQSLIAISVAISLSPTFSYSADLLAPWLSQIGLTTNIQSSANWGKGTVLGIVDTGIYAGSPSFAPGQVSSTLSACAALSFSCSNGVNDDNGHGTAVAAIAAGNRTLPFAVNYGGYVTSANSIISVAPNANIVAEKVLNASGTGYSFDVANGIRKAVDAGVAVINVSITYGNSPDLISSINYAASKGVFIVWAGGNSSIPLLGGGNTSGLTFSGINHLIFAGSVNSKNVLSSFSNTPGAGVMNNLNGTAPPGVTNINYQSRWVMAPGEAIIAPYNPSQPNAWATWSGTSMSAPIVSGSLLLLESAWPILKTNGSAANLLIATATDLGAKGIDSSYGNGLINLTTAFNPYGSLMVTNAKGSPVNVSSLTGSLVSSGALGALSAIQSKLSNYTAFDSYSRNYSVNLANMIKSPSTAALLNPLPSNVKTAPLAIKYADGTVISTWIQEDSNPSDHLGEFNYNESRVDESKSAYLSVNYQNGTTMAFGDGYPAQFSYGEAFFGNTTMAILSSQLSTDGLSSLADGGRLLSYGTRLSDKARFALAWNASPTVNSLDFTAIPHSADNLKVGLNYQFTDQLFAGVSVGTLSESNALLGSNYLTGSAIGFSPNNRSFSIGFSSGYLFNANNSMLIETGFSTTQAAQGLGLIAGTADIQSKSLGASFMSRNLIKNEDRLIISFKQPLRVTSGQAGITSASVNSLGQAQYATQWVSLVPNGLETDYKVTYDTPIGHDKTLSLQAGYRQDLMNTNGNNDKSIGATWKMAF